MLLIYDSLATRGLYTNITCMFLLLDHESGILVD